MIMMILITSAPIILKIIININNVIKVCTEYSKILCASRISEEPIGKELRNTLEPDINRGSEFGPCAVVQSDARKVDTR